MIARTKMNPIKKNHDAMLRTGAMALAAAGASTAAHAATVQITFQNSFISSTSGITALDTDFGGDFVADVAGGFGGNAASVVSPIPVATSFGGSRLSVVAAVFGAFTNGYASVGSARLRGPDISLSGLVAFTLTDANVVGGVATPGWLDVTATARGNGGGFTEQRVVLHRFIFDDTGLGAPTDVAHSDAAYPEYVAAAVPEPSGLGLLALGAGGLLARRRRAMAA